MRPAEPPRGGGPAAAIRRIRSRVSQMTASRRFSVGTTYDGGFASAAPRRRDACDVSGGAGDVTFESGRRGELARNEFDAHSFSRRAWRYTGSAPPRFRGVPTCELERMSDDVEPPARPSDTDDAVGRMYPDAEAGRARDFAPGRRAAAP